METPEVDRIRVCIDRYMEGISTQEELRMLKNYFNGNREIPADLLPYREMFAIIDRETVRLSDDAVRRLSRIGERRNGVRLWPWIAAACAVALLLVITAPPKGGSAVQPQLAETVFPQPSAPVPEIADTVREDAVRENAVREDAVHKNAVHKNTVREDAVLENSTQKDTATVKTSPKDMMHFALPPVLETALADAGNEPEPDFLCDTTGVGQQLMALEMEFLRQDSIYIMSLIESDEEATLAANSIYVSLLE